MSLKLYEEQSVQEIADAIRAKNGSSNTYKIGEMATAVSEIQAGSGSTITDISLGLTSATVGQIAKISAVDNNGVPTAWTPVDMPSGGGEEAWELIREIELENDVAFVAVDKDDAGQSFMLHDIFVVIAAVAPIDETITYNGNLALNFNTPKIWTEQDMFVGSSPKPGEATRTLVSLYNTVAGKLLQTFAKTSYGNSVPNTLTGKIDYTDVGAIKLLEPGVLPSESPCTKINIGSYRKCLYTGTTIKVYGVRT